MKLWYDKKAKLHKFKVGDKVLVLLPLQNHALQTRYCGPYLGTEKVNNVSYIKSTSECTQLRTPKLLFLKEI